MNANQLINMIVRMVVRKAVNHGVNAGVNAIGRGSENAGRARPQQERNPDAKAPPKFDAKQARQVTRLARRIGRF